MTDNTSLLAPTFLFRFAIPCHSAAELWPATDIELPPLFRMPSFGELDGRRSFADLRMGWTVEGIALSLRVTGKKRSLWSRDVRPSDSDGVTVWLDTRNTQNIHRASRFCHQLAILPAGSGAGFQDPTGRIVPIDRAREHPSYPHEFDIKVRSEIVSDGYVLRAAIPKQLLTGYDPDEQRELGFTYAIFDTELGVQTLALGGEFPYDSDPSLWGTLELVTHTARGQE